jgi:hypothetical protein
MVPRALPVPPILISADHAGEQKKTPRKATPIKEIISSLLFVKNIILLLFLCGIYVKNIRGSVMS